LFILSGDGFLTSPIFDDLYLPNNEEWTTKSYPLENYVGKTVIIRLEMLNGYGNNLYLDNVSVNYAVAVAETAPLKMEVYPNPAADYFEVNLPENASGGVSDIALTDALGRVVFRAAKAGGGILRVPRGKLPSGVYFLKLMKNGRSQDAVRVVFI
jgi:Secretion system C-terminal sorting domain